MNPSFATVNPQKTSDKTTKESLFTQ